MTRLYIQHQTPNNGWADSVTYTQYSDTQVYLVSPIMAFTLDLTDGYYWTDELQNDPVPERSWRFRDEEGRPYYSTKISEGKHLPFPVEEFLADPQGRMHAVIITDLL